MKKTNQEKGITLIALVITIIVLLILAGVTLSIVLDSNNGLIAKAKQAANQTESAAKDEQKILEDMEKYIAENISPWDGSTVATGFAGGTGTEQDPYIIENAEQLAYLANQVNNGQAYEGKYLKITKSINLGNQKWTPIGIGISGARTEWIITKAFKGNLNGEGNVIANINVNEPNIHGVGLIGVLEEGAVVQNIKVSKGTIIGKTCVAGIVGANKGTVKDCYNSANIVAQDNEDSNSGEVAGGIVGWIERGTIENCVNYGSVITRDDSLQVSRGKRAGGIVGAIGGTTNVLIKGCTNYGEIRCMYQLVGGIAGAIDYNGGTFTIENCINTGKIVAEYHEFTTSSSLGSVSGGIVGWISSGEGTITNCSNSGEIVAERQQVGGIVGKQNAGTIINCSNTGNIIAKFIDGVANSGIFSGGIVGWQKGGEITNCSNSGEIIAEKAASGGIVGRQDLGTVENCDNSGKVIAKSQGVGGFSGGIVGYQLGGTITNVYNMGQVEIGNFDTGIDAIGGIVGYQTGGTISKAYNKGTLIGGEAIGGVIGQQKLAGIVEKTYYYTAENIKAIGSKSDDTTVITPANDVAGKTEKTTQNISSYADFLLWIETK